MALSSLRSDAGMAAVQMHLFGQERGREGRSVCWEHAPTQDSLLTRDLPSSLRPSLLLVC